MPQNLPSNPQSAHTPFAFRFSDLDGPVMACPACAEGLACMYRHAADYAEPLHCDIGDQGWDAILCDMCGVEVLEALPADDPDAGPET